MKKLFFDLLITIGIVITAAPAVILLFSRKYRPGCLENRYKKTSLIISLILLLGTLTFIYGSFIEPRFLIVNEYSVDLPKINQPIKIAFVTDFQVGPYRKTEWIKKVVDKTLAIQPDLVILGGDQVDNDGTTEDQTIYLSPLQNLAKLIPTYAIHGNHEYGIGGGRAIKEPKFRQSDVSAQTKQTMENFGITYLVNSLEKITIDKQSFYLFGGDEYWADKLDFSELNDKAEPLDTIAVIHNPSFQFSNYPDGIDLVLSGHTHGGQIRLPFWGPVGRIDGILPAEHYKGLNQIEKTKLLVSSGAGETATRARLFNPPEIVLLTIY